MREKIEAKLRELNMANEIVQTVIASLAPCAALRVSDVTGDEAIAVGASKFGGVPDVPADFGWPMHQGSALDFLVQINMADIARMPIAADLPKSGLISVFIASTTPPRGQHPDDRTACDVYLFPLDYLQRNTPQGMTLTPQRITPVAGEIMPSLRSQQLDLGEIDDDQLDEYYTAFEFNSPLVDEDAGGPDHRLLGHPRLVSDAVQMTCQLASNGIPCGDGDDLDDPRVEELSAGADDWRLLLQIDSSDALSFGMMGRLFIMIRASELAKGSIHGCWAVTQSMA